GRLGLGPGAHRPLGQRGRPRARRPRPAHGPPGARARQRHLVGDRLQEPRGAAHRARAPGAAARLPQRLAGRPARRGGAAGLHHGPRPFHRTGFPGMNKIGAAIIGGGPAGLMAAEVLSRAGVAVDLYDAMPSVGRKLLLAGRGGLNLTHAEPFEDFVGRFGARAAQLRPLLQAFGPQALRDWAEGLGIATFVGSSRRVFPTDMKAAPLLRAWLRRRRHPGEGGAPVRFHVRHRWQGFGADGALRFATPEGEVEVQAEAVLLALGGASWPRLGSDGGWLPWLREAGAQ